jgi:trehalose 6-phosphate synthase
MGFKRLLVAANRGPLYTPTEDKDVHKHASGGLVSALYDGLQNRDSIWYGSKQTISSDNEFRLQNILIKPINIDDLTYKLAYNEVSNKILWACHHHLFDPTYLPLNDYKFKEAWRAYKSFNEMFADAILKDANEDDLIIVNDYHLYLCPQYLKAANSSLKVLFFSHIPFASATHFNMLSTEFGESILYALTSANATGFHSHQWAGFFAECLDSCQMNRNYIFVAPLGADQKQLVQYFKEEAFIKSENEILEIKKHYKVLLRVDRLEPSKNIVRGFHAFRDFLEQNPEFRTKVVFLAHFNPSREDLEEYRRYKNEVMSLIQDINNRYKTDNWQPILATFDNNYLASLAALKHADACLVNPIRDGLNLVAKEFGLLSENATLILSKEAGAYEELKESVIGISPFDVAETSDAIKRAITLNGHQREKLAKDLKTTCEKTSPAKWLDRLIAIGEAN